MLYWNRALEKAPDDNAIHLVLARLHLKLEDFAAAEKHFEAILPLRPVDPAYYLEYARALDALDKIDAAVAVLRLGRDLAADRGETDFLPRFDQRIAELSAILPGAEPPSGQAGSAP
ncbi:MAG: hypothetical protein D6781_10215 [Verrucomicrobia bacterium]|nr:MAG: hypothetical protein D6781_10215 [Verrucomicrobiota bacterium]